MVTLYRDPEGTTWGTTTGWATEKVGVPSGTYDHAAPASGDTAELNGAAIVMEGDINLGSGTIQNTDGGYLMPNLATPQTITANLVAIANELVDGTSAGASKLKVVGNITGGAVAGAKGVLCTGIIFEHVGLATGGSNASAYAISAVASQTGAKTLGSLKRGSAAPAFYASHASLSVTVLGSLTFRNGQHPVSAVGGFTYSPVAGSTVNFNDALLSTFIPTTDVVSAANVKSGVARYPGGTSGTWTGYDQTFKVVDPAGHGDYATLDAAITGEMTTTGDLVLVCRKGKCSANDTATLEVKAMACRSLKILPERGHGHNGNLDQPLASCAYSSKRILWTPNTATTLLNVEIRGMRFEGCTTARFRPGYTGMTYNLTVVQNLISMTGLPSAAETSPDGVQCLPTAGTMNLIAVDNTILAQNCGDNPLMGYILCDAYGTATINACVYGNTCNSDNAADMADAISFYTTNGGVILADVRNNAVFNAANGAFTVSGENVTITGGYNLADDETPTSAIGGTGNQVNKPAATVLADTLKSAVQLNTSPGLAAGVAITQVPQYYLRPHGSDWDIGVAVDPLTRPAASAVLSGTDIGDGMTGTLDITADNPPAGGMLVVDG